MTTENKTVTQMEKALLSSMFAMPEQYSIVGSIVDEDMFYSSKHKIFFKALKTLILDDEPVDMNTIKYQLDKLDGSFLMSDIISFVDEMPVGHVAEYYAKKVKDQAVRRNIDKILKEGLHHMQDPSQDTDVVIGDILSKVTNAIPVDKRTPSSIYPEITEVWEEYLDNEEKGHDSVIKTGYIDLDRAVSLTRGTHSIVGASPGDGKTSLGACILRHVSATGKRPLFFTLEQSRQVMMQILIAQEANICLSNFMTGQLSQEEKNQINNSAHKWANSNIGLIDGEWSANKIRLRIKNEIDENGLDIAFVDTLTLMEKPEHMSRDAKDHQIYNENCRLLQNIAKEFNIHIMTMTHLNRERYKRQGCVPILSDLREAGEQFASIVVFIYREFNVNPDPELENISELLVAKNRHGKVGKLALGWHGESTTFFNLAKPHDKPPGPQEKMWNDVDKEDGEQTVWGGGIQ